MELFQDFLFWDTLWQWRVEIGIDPYKLDSHVDFTDCWIHDESIIECLTTFYFMRSIVKRFNTKFQMIFNFLSNPLPWLLNVKIHAMLKENFKTYHNHYAPIAINLFVSYKTPVWFHLILFTNKCWFEYILICTLYD